MRQMLLNALLVGTVGLGAIANAKYADGGGMEADPYRSATAVDPNLIRKELADWEAAITSANPLHWYKFDATSRTNCIDSGSGKLNGTYDGPRPGQEGLLGPTSAAVFDRITGTNRVSFPGAANLTGPWTAEYIVMSTKPAAANDGMALHDSDTTSIRLSGWTALGEVGFTLYDVLDYQFTPSAGYTLENLIAPLNQWIHLTFRRDNFGTQVFINGELMGTSSNSVDFPRQQIGAWGRTPVTVCLQGVLDDAVVFNRALSDRDILAHAATVGLVARARDPSPADGAVMVNTPLLQWKAGVNALFHNVYLGISPQLTQANLVASYQSLPMYSPPAGLQPGTTYYWRVDEIAAVGIIVVGDIWHFTTAPLPAPSRVPTAEGFEKGLGNLPWSSVGWNPWAVVSSESHSGGASAQAGAIGDDGTTSLSVKLNAAAGKVSFWLKVSSEPKADFLIFSIDGKEQGRWSGEMGWQKVSFSAAEGLRTFTWTYKKDNMFSEGQDTAWIDDIIFPDSIKP